jgi:hypothetical protein
VIAGSLFLPWLWQLNPRSAWRIGIGLVVVAVIVAVSAIAQNRWIA